MFSLSNTLRLTLFAGLLASCFSVHATDAIRQSLAKIHDNLEDLSISQSPIPGISEVSIGLQIMYISNDGKYILGGPLIDADTRTNLSERQVDAARRELLAQHNDVTRFNYKANESKHRVTVFTDIDCPHCRRLHNEIPALQAAGVDVQYIMLPRAGKNSKSYLKTVSAACAENPEEAITAAMAGQQPQATTCKNPIDQQMALARTLQVSSTPTIILDSGKVVLGYKDAQTLVKSIKDDAL